MVDSAAKENGAVAMRQWLRFAVIIEGDKRGMAETKYDKIYRDLKEKI